MKRARLGDGETADSTEERASSRVRRSSRSPQNDLAQPQARAESPVILQTFEIGL